MYVCVISGIVICTYVCMYVYMYVSLCIHCNILYVRMTHFLPQTGEEGVERVSEKDERS